jgi:hypothetical protein
LFYGNGGTKFPKLTTGGASGLVALFCTLQRAFQLTRVQVELLLKSSDLKSVGDRFPYDSKSIGFESDGCLATDYVRRVSAA